MDSNYFHVDERFHWVEQPLAAALVTSLVETVRVNHSAVREIADRLYNETGTRLIDWVDHLVVSSELCPDRQLNEAGFVIAGDSAAAEYGGTSWRHNGGLFPLIVTSDEVPSRLALCVESVSEFVAVCRTAAGCPILGDPLAEVRAVKMETQNGIELWAVERHGSRGWTHSSIGAEAADRLVGHREAIERRPRDCRRDETGFDRAMEIVCSAIAALGVDRTCDLFFAGERAYWQQRNQAAQIQRARQDALGLGWANQDHHTYRSSREHFQRLIAVFETLGCQCRERFYAGADAGWGAQVLEQPECGIVIFADVDLTPDELSGDFAHQPLAERTELGTVGLWCQLHGEAFLQAGMHHLECQFDFNAARAQLAASGIETMEPFSNFNYLKQAFTIGEIWDVAPQRLDNLVAEGRIEAEQAKRFRREGALGSHLEILERNNGYKGFNQTGVSAIIRKTDPRGVR